MIRDLSNALYCCTSVKAQAMDVYVTLPISPGAQRVTIDCTDRDEDIVGDVTLVSVDAWLYLGHKTYGKHLHILVSWLISVPIGSLLSRQRDPPQRSL